MSNPKRRKHDSTEKVKVALEAIREEQSINEIASKYKLYPGQVRQWKKDFLEDAESVFKNDKEEKKHLSELETEKRKKKYHYADNVSFWIFPDLATTMSQRVALLLILR